jgi:hypothetical protein
VLKILGQLTVLDLPQGKGELVYDIAARILPLLSAAGDMPHELCILLANLNSCTELYTLDTYLPFASAVYERTITCLANPAFSENSIDYLLQFWESLLPHVIQTSHEQLRTCIVTLVQRYIERRLTVQFDTEELEMSLYVINPLARVDPIAIGTWCQAQFNTFFASQQLQGLSVMIYILGILIFDNQKILAKHKRFERNKAKLPLTPPTLEETEMNGTLATLALTVVFSPLSL